MKEEHYNLLVIGAGPAGLFLARELLLHSNMKINLIDGGYPITKRHCPLVEVGKCPQCNTCHAVYGSGGAGMYSDGKLSSYPAGSGLVKILGDEESVISLNNYVLNTFLSGMDEEYVKRTKANESRNSCIVQTATDNMLDFKCYDVYHVGTEGIIEYCIKLEKEVIQLGGMLTTQCTLLGVEKFGDIFVSTLKNNRGQISRISSNNVVMATGKASGLFLRKVAKELGVKFEYNAIELGVRIETNQQAINALSESHLDAKIKLTLDDDCEVRTFCMCNGGYLVNCYYDSFVPNEKIATISGFSFRDRKSDNSNFGVLVRKKFPDNMDPISMQIGIVQTINKASGYGGTVVQRYGDFMANQPTNQRDLQLNSIKSTLPQATPVNLRWLLPDYVTKAVEAFLQKLSSLEEGLITEDVLLHAPVWELCLDRIIVNSDLSTTVPGFYVAGDAIGWARGIIQAASTGVVIARDILRRSGMPIGEEVLSQ